MNIQTTFSSYSTLIFILIIDPNVPDVYLAGAAGPANPVVAVTTSGSAATGFSALYLENWIAAVVPAAPLVLLILIGLVAKTRPSSGRTRRNGYVPKGKEIQLTTISPDTYVAPVYTPSAAVITPGGYVSVVADYCVSLVSGTESN